MTPTTHHAPRNYHPENIAGKAVLVTGGTTGIGFAIAKLLLERGARVFTFGRDENDLQSALTKLRESGEVYGMTADQSQPEEIKRIFREADARLGGLDILVNNAAVGVKSAVDNSLEEIQYGVNVNLFGYMACAHEVIARMKAKGSGHIVCIGSLSAHQREEESDIYVATKAGIQAYCASLRKGVSDQNIKVSLIEPGLVASDMSGSSPEEETEQQRQGKMLAGEDIAEAVHYVLTQPARCDVIGIQIRPHQEKI